MPAKIDSTGRQFGRLTVIREQKKRNKHNCIMWLCQCQCGRKVTVRGGLLRSSETKSCGCYHRETASHTGRQTRIHGDSGKKTRLYITWCSMKQRCSNKNDKNYGGRGIKVCKLWQDYRAFKKWALAHGYREDLQIDRINNNGNYTPSNCRWVTDKENRRNTRRTRWFTISGETKSLAEWCEVYDILYRLVHHRLTSGWDIIDALTKPLQR